MDDWMNSALETLAIRRATIEDCHEMARLLKLLGHATDSNRVANRWADWVSDGNLALVAATVDSRLAGLATLHKMHVLHRPKPVGRVTALIVDTNWRHQGVGKYLLSQAEQELILAGCGIVEITSHARLVEAHAFYEHVGYSSTGIRFAKDFGEADCSQCDESSFSASS